MCVGVGGGVCVCVEILDGEFDGFCMCGVSREEDREKAAQRGSKDKGPIAKGRGERRAES